MSSASASVEQALAPLLAAGGRAYLGEPVTQAVHAAQTARLAVDAGASGSLAVAALLHDVGWLLGGDGDGHAGRGAAYLDRLGLPLAVSEPVRLHVEAKRWLCATSPAYRRRLSAASEATLVRQGGPMCRPELVAFESEPWADAAVRLRRWDDDAKVPGLAGLPVEEWPALVEAVALSARGRGRPADPARSR